MENGQSEPFAKSRELTPLYKWNARNSIRESGNFRRPTTR